MTETTFRHALIVGAGDGFSASLARRFRRDGLAATLARRTPDPSDATTAAFAADGVATLACDAADPESVGALFDQLDDHEAGAPDLVVYNPSARARGPLVELDPMDVERALEVTAFGAFLVAQAAARRMMSAPEGGVRGAIMFTGASASVKGFAMSAPFAMGKFAQRGLAQSLARELHPKGVRILHVVVDGAIRSVSRDRVEGADGPADRFLDPDSMAETCWSLLNQDRSAWTWEIELRPWVERF